MKIIGEYIVIDGRSFHPKHFTCSKCNKPINGNYYKNDGKYFDSNLQNIEENVIIFWRTKRQSSICWMWTKKWIWLPSSPVKIELEFSWVPQFPQPGGEFVPSVAPMIFVGRGEHGVSYFIIETLLWVWNDPTSRAVRPKWKYPLILEVIFLLD